MPTIPGYLDPSLADTDLILTREMLALWLHDLSLFTSYGQYATEDQIVVGPADGRTGTVGLDLADGDLVVGINGTIGTLPVAPNDDWVLMALDGAPVWTDPARFRYQFLATGLWT